MRSQIDSLVETYLRCGVTKLLIVSYSNLRRVDKTEVIVTLSIL